LSRQLSHLENNDRIIVRRHQRHRARREEVGRVSDGSLTESPDHSAMAGERSATYLPWTVARTRVQLTARWHKLHGGTPCSRRESSRHGPCSRFGKSRNSSFFACFAILHLLSSVRRRILAARPRPSQVFNCLPQRPVLGVLSDNDRCVITSMFARKGCLQQEQQRGEMSVYKSHQSADYIAK